MAEGDIPGWPPNVNFTKTCALLRGCPGQQEGYSVYPKDALPQEIEANFSYKCKWEDCRRKFQRAEMLLSHVERSHVWIQTDTKNIPSIRCNWKDCGVTNFPQQYCVLIHVRDHCEQSYKVRFNPAPVVESET